MLAYLIRPTLLLTFPRPRSHDTRLGWLYGYGQDIPVILSSQAVIVWFIRQKFLINLINKTIITAIITDFTLTK